MDDRKPHILVVDDEPVMRTITESVLAQQEFEVSTANSAEEAILMISEGLVPDLLLLDVLMPGMNGFEACRILRPTLRLIESRVTQPLDYSRLLKQLRSFHYDAERIRAQWAQEFYRQPTTEETSA